MSVEARQVEADDSLSSAPRMAPQDRAYAAHIGRPRIDSGMPHSVDNSPAMGPLEFAVYRKAWQNARCYHLNERDMVARREVEDVAKAARAAAIKAAEASLRLAGQKIDRRNIEEAFTDLIIENDVDPSRRDRITEMAPGRAAARLLFARMFDQRPDLCQAIKAEAPVILIDIPDSDAFSRILGGWTDIILPTDACIAQGKVIDESTQRGDFDAIAYVAFESLKSRDVLANEATALRAVQLALPTFAISPGAETYLPKPFRDAATARLTFPSLDAPTITRVIRLVTSKSCRTDLPSEIVREIGYHELALAVRFDRTPQECLSHLHALAERKISKKAARDLTLDELHGMDEAVGWAKSTIRDVEAWRRGEIHWDAVDHAVVLNGPPGTGKTTFGKVFAEAAGLPLILASLAKWQGTDEGHLGHLLRAMRRDFEEARSKSPCVMLIDEVDSFPIRAELTHSHRDYEIQVVNGFLEQLDGLAGREGIIFLGASNDVTRCDPAILRSGRLNRIIQLRMPAPEDLEKIYRVRLHGALKGVDLKEISLLSVGMTGADVERTVKDALRSARHEERDILIDDLERTVIGERKLSPEKTREIAIHEAGHILLDVIHFGPDDVHAVILRRPGSQGSVWRIRNQHLIDNQEHLTNALQVLMAGRAAEDLVFGRVSVGSGGSDNSDLAAATKMASAMVASLGFAGPHPLVYLASPREAETALKYDYMRIVVNDVLTTAYEETKRLLAKHRHALQKIADALVASRVIDGHQVSAIIHLTATDNPAEISEKPNFKRSDAAPKVDGPNPGELIGEPERLASSIDRTGTETHSGNQTQVEEEKENVS